MSRHLEGGHVRILAFILALILIFPPIAFPTEAQAAQTITAGQSASGLSSQSVKTTASASALGLVSGHTYVIYSSLDTSKSLEVKNGSLANRANVRIANFNRATHQQWAMTIGSDGYATFQSMTSGKFLAVKGASAAVGANVFQQNGNGSLNQKWTISRNSNGTYRIASALSPSISLDAGGKKSGSTRNVRVWTTSTKRAQQWRFYDVTSMRASLAKKAKANKGLVKARKYVVFSKVGTNMVLDISGNSKADGANLQLYRYNNSAAQQFRLVYDKNGYAQFKCNSGKLLDVNGGSAVNSTNVQQYAANDTLAQKWVISKNSDGTYRITSALWSNVSLDVSGAGTSNGTNIHIYSDNDTAAQKWRFRTPAQARKTISLPLVGTTLSSYNGISLAGAKAAGVDVSIWQGDIDWNRVAASGIKFAIIRCGYGNNSKSQDDAKFLSNVQGARAAGLDIGVYLYSYATDTNMAASEANHTLRLLQAAGLTGSNTKYGVWYDIEADGQADADLASICQTYCNKIQAQGYSPGVYASLYWWNNYLTSPVFDQWPRWVAQYPIKSGAQTCQYQGSYKIWQCMSDGVVPGIVGRADMNLAY